MKTIKTIAILIILLMGQPGFALHYFAEKFCSQPDFSCTKIKTGDSWEKLFPDAETLDIVRRVNRMNTRLKPGMVIAVPKNLDRLTIYDVSPFPRYIDGTGEKSIYISQKELAFAAYDGEGELVWWGPVSSGNEKCQGVFGGCVTPSGSFRIIRKQDIDCISTAFPRRADGMNGGAEMPYCMHFFRGFALHGSEQVPGFRASHGCVRLFTEDARWLNEEFVDLPQGEMKGTRVIIDEPERTR